jgi:hypothetical protein
MQDFQPQVVQYEACLATGGLGKIQTFVAGVMTSVEEHHAVALRPTQAATCLATVERTKLSRVHATRDYRRQLPAPP